MALTGRQKSDLERLIRERRERLAAELRADAAKARDEQYVEVTGGAAGDIGDEATADVIADTGLAELSRDLQELRALDGALARIAAGELGTCADCGLEIGFERLAASPGAIRCVDCQRLHEATVAAPRTPSL